MTVKLKKSCIRSKWLSKTILKVTADYGSNYASNKKFINLRKSLVKVSAGSRMIKDRGGSDMFIQSFYCKVFIRF